MTGFTRQRNGRGNTLIQRITAGRSIGFASCAVASPDSCIEMIRENSWHQRAFASGQFYSSEIVMAPEATCEVPAVPRALVLSVPSTSLPPCAIWGMEPRSSNDERTRGSSEGASRPRLLLSLITVVIVLWLLYWFLVDLLYPPGAEDGGGVFGDKFGALNALFSGLAFAGILYTIALQRQDLSIQSRQIAEAERERQRNAYESLFFHLLHFHQDIVKGLYDPPGRRGGEPVPEAHGRQVLDRFYDDLLSDLSPRGGSVDKQQFLDALRGNDFIRNEGVWPYHQNFLVLMKHLARADAENRAIFADIVKAQLSEAERVWILAYSLTPIGEQEFGPLVSTVGLLNDWNPYPDLRSVLALLPAAST